MEMQPWESVPGAFLCPGDVYFFRNGEKKDAEKRKQQTPLDGKNRAFGGRRRDAARGDAQAVDVDGETL